MDSAAEKTESSEVSRFTNVALGRPAQQSSISPWSEPGEAAKAVSGIRPPDFAFHTSHERNPWWLVDLGRVYPLDSIVISNRLAGFQERAKSLRVEVSGDADRWILIHQGLAVFGSVWTGDPFTLWLKGAVAARYVRLTLDAEETLHLSQVEVLVRREDTAFADYCEKNNLINLQDKFPHEKYVIINGERATTNRVVGLDMNYSARFGNLLIQIINTIMLAQKTGLRYIRLGHHKFLHVKERFERDGIVFLPHGAALPDDGLFLSGNFFVSDPFVPVLMPFLRFTQTDEREFTRVVREFVRPFMLHEIPLPTERHDEDEVTIHLRSGDVFEPYTPIVRGYRQPPLSFYHLVLSNLFTHHGVRRVRLVFEDRGNPCVDALEQWLVANDVPVRIQCGSMHEDMSALVDAPHLVFGHGTFGYAACRLSRRIKTVHYFEPELGGAYGSITSIDRVFSVSDARGEYIEAFEYGKPLRENGGWFNTPENRETMLTYPIEALALKELPLSLRRAD